MIYEFMATQDLHGYEKPWAGGTNINLFDESTVVFGKWIQADGTISTLAGGCVSAFISVDALSKITVTYFGDKPYTMVYAEYAEDDTFIKRVQTTLPKTWDLDEACAKVQFAIAHPNYTTPGSIMTPQVLKDCQVVCYQGTDPVTSYSPYANVCMPEGFNIWDPIEQEYFQVYAGYVNANTRELYLRPVYKEYAGEELVGPWMSSLDPYEEDTTPTEGAFVIDFGGELTSYEITPFMLQTLLDSLGIRQHFTNGAGLLNSLMDQAQGRVRSEEELLHLSRPLKVIAIGDQLPASLTFKPISKDVLPGLPGKFIR